MTWRVARSLDTLLAEINAAAPNRSKISDGSIGDTSHSSRYSDHNPNPAGVVRARDFTHDPENGCDGHEIADAVRLLGINGHPALGPGAYVIWQGEIASATYGWVWRIYTGTNPHNHHIHVSVQTAAPGYDSTAAWLTLEEDMPKYTDWDKSDREALAADVARAVSDTDLGDERILKPDEFEGPKSRSLRVMLWTILKLLRKIEKKVGA